LAHLYTQKNCTVDSTETRGAASRGSISTGWPRKHITIVKSSLVMTQYRITAATNDILTT